MFKKGHTINNGKKFTLEHKLKMSDSKRKGKIESIKNGYVIVYSPFHPFAKRHYVKRSRLVSEKHLKRYLADKEEVHHINFNQTDDRPVNLYVFSSKGQHMSYHRKLKYHPEIYKNKLKSNL